MLYCSQITTETAPCGKNYCCFSCPDREGCKDRCPLEPACADTCENRYEETEAVAKLETAALEVMKTIKTIAQQKEKLDEADKTARQQLADEKLIESYERDLKAGFHPANTTYSAILTHEVGHAIDDYLTNTLHAAGMSGWKPKWVSAALRPKVMRACGLKISDIEKSVSGYATQNHFEWFAECFAEYMESPNPRPVAQKFGEMLEELLKGVPDNADA